MSVNHQRDDESQFGRIIAISVALSVASTLIVSLRLYTRHYILHNVGPDDWTIVLAQVLAIVVSILTCMEAVYGLGRHTSTVPLWSQMMQLQCLYAVIVTYNIGLNTVKLSFLLFYRRIFRDLSLDKVCNWMMLFVSCWMIAQVVMLATSCIPLSIIHPSMQGSCLNTVITWNVSSGLSTFTDFCIFIIPLPSVLKLRLPLKQKIGLAFVFCLGFFTCIVSVVRIFTLRVAVEGTDPTWDSTDAACWSIIELNCAVLASSLPVLRPLVFKFVPGSSAERSAWSVYRLNSRGSQSNRPDDAEEGGSSTRNRHKDSPESPGSSFTFAEDRHIEQVDGPTKDAVVITTVGKPGSLDTVTISEEEAIRGIAITTETAVTVERAAERC